MNEMGYGLQHNNDRTVITFHPVELGRMATMPAFAAAKANTTVVETTPPMGEESPHLSGYVPYIPAPRMSA